MGDDTIQAFFSYSHRDWKAAERNGPIPNVLGHLFEQIEREVHASGVDRFTKWVDHERLRWADQWSDELERAIAASELFFVFLSPGWLASKVCRRELETFRDRQSGLVGKRVFVAQIRPLSPKQQNDHRQILAELRHLQCKDNWQSLLVADEDARVAACQKAGQEVAEQLERLHSMPSPTPTPGTGSRRCSATRLTGERKLASGALLIPNQGDVVDGTILVQLRLLFREWCEVRTRRGILTFGASSASLCLEATGGTMKTHPELVEYRKSTRVSPAETEGHERFFYTIESLDGTLRGNVLSAHDDYVPAVSVVPTGDAPVTVSGQMDLALGDITIDPARSDKKHRARLNSDDEDIRRKMHESLAKLILEEHFKAVDLGCVEA